MTRINADIDPKALADQHLLAEYNEIGMFYSSLRRSIKSKNGIKNIPAKFTLNKGHVSFFYNKLLFVEDRYDRIRKELSIRGFDLNPFRIVCYPNEFPVDLYNNWHSSTEDEIIIKSRIYEKIMQKPTWYKYRGIPMPQTMIDYFKV